MQLLAILADKDVITQWNCIVGAEMLPQRVLLVRLRLTLKLLTEDRPASSSSYCRIRRSQQGMLAPKPGPVNSD